MLFTIRSYYVVYFCIESSTKKNCTFTILILNFQDIDIFKTFDAYLVLMADTRLDIDTYLVSEADTKLGIDSFSNYRYFAHSYSILL